MGCSYYVTFHRKPTDPEWETKFAAVVALAKAGVTRLPEELAAYFKTPYADPETVKDALIVATASVDYPTERLPMPGVSRESYDSGAEVVIDLDELPKDIRVIRAKLGC